MNALTGKRIGWSVVNLLVLLYALIPVIWIVSLHALTFRVRRHWWEPRS
jgi:hypothetical protein